MIDLPLDEDGYPTEEALKTIEKFEDWRNLEKLFAAIKNIWAYPDYFSGPLDEPPKEILPLLWREPKSKWYCLATAGWSGNELIIAALQKNPIIKGFCWYMSARGGLHVYQLRIPESN